MAQTLRKRYSNERKFTIPHPITQQIARVMKIISVVYDIEYMNIATYQSISDKGEQALKQRGQESQDNQDRIKVKKCQKTHSMTKYGKSIKSQRYRLV